MEMNGNLISGGGFMGQAELGSRGFRILAEIEQILLAQFQNVRYHYCDSYHMQCLGAGVCRSHLLSPLFPPLALPTE
jgi:hypothetical protein